MYVRRLNFIIKLRLLIITIVIFSITCTKKHSELISPQEDLFPEAPKNLTAQVGDRQITLSWEMNTNGTNYSYHIYRKDTINTEMMLIDSCTAQKYIDVNVKNGIIYHYKVCAVNEKGFEGKYSNEVKAMANIFGVIIDNGDEYTNNQAVLLSLTAPIITRYMWISNDSSFNNPAWEPFASTKSWSLTAGDGEKHVYVKFKNEDGSESQQPAHDAIILDTKANIVEVTENTAGVIKAPGDTIHFKLVAGEPNGQATIDIGEAALDITLYDDATNGDVTANDGTYELNYIIPPGLEVVNAIITGHFIDRVNNIADVVTAPGRITIQQTPISITLFTPVPSGSGGKALELYWTRSSESDFSSYRLFRATATGVSTSSQLLTMITDISNTNYTDTDVKENIDYYYRVYVYDKSGLAQGSNEVSGKIESNTPPVAVTLYPPAPVAGSVTSLSLSWSKNEDQDFTSYKIYRSLTSGVDSYSTLVTTIPDRNRTDYEDTDLRSNTEYYYRVYVFDSGGLSTGSNEEKGKTSTNEPPTAVTLYPPTPIAGSLTSLSLSWSKSIDNDFASYKIYRSLTAGVDSTSLLIVTLTSQNTTEYEDSGLQTNTEYYYRVYVYDTGGLASGSNEEKGKTNANEPPTAVTLNPPAPVAGSLTSLSLSWSKNNDNDFASYKIYRDFNSGVDSTATLVTTISAQNTTDYEDTDLQADTEYYYRIYVYDTGGLCSGSNEEKGKTNANEPPTAVTLNSPSPVAGSLTSLSLSWSKNEDNDFASYKIYRSLAAGVDSTSTLVTTITDQNTTNYEDTDLQADTEYYYRIYVYDTGGLSRGSNEEKGKTNANEPPKAVTLYTPSPVEGSTSSLSLSWSKNEDTDFASYKIYRSLTAGVDSLSTYVTTIQEQGTTDYEDKELEQDTDYYYRVYVYDTGGLATGSNEAMGTTNANEPPTAVILAQPAVVDSITLRISWSKNDDEDFSMYSIYRSTSSPVDTTNAPIAIINDQETTEYDDTNLIMNNEYFYRVFVKDEGGLSSGSNEVSGTPRP